MFRRVKLFADGASLGAIEELAEQRLIDGFTTNPTLMRKAGVVFYEDFAAKAARLAGSKPISLEVFADDLPTMERQARRLGSMGNNIWVKIPITNTAGESTEPIWRRLAEAGIKLNITAVFTFEQVLSIVRALPFHDAIISVFAGRIADAGQDAVAFMRDYKAMLNGRPQLSLLWASPRQVYDAVLADKVGADIITMTPDLIKKLETIGKSLDQFSLETVQMFHRDAAEAAYSIELPHA